MKEEGKGNKKTLSLNHSNPFPIIPANAGIQQMRVICDWTRGWIPELVRNDVF